MKRHIYHDHRQQKLKEYLSRCRDLITNRPQFKWKKVVFFISFISCWLLLNNKWSIPYIDTTSLFLAEDTTTSATNNTYTTTASVETKTTIDDTVPSESTKTKYDLLSSTHTIQIQLPDKECIATSKQPWMNKCSFSYATRCPDPIWLLDQYNIKSTPPPQQQRQQQHQRIGIYVGCNKGMDAINTLRMLSHNTTYDRNVWRTYLLSNSSTNYEPGRCQQEFNEQYNIPPNSPAYNNAIVHCIEAMPITAKKLVSTAQLLHWSNQDIDDNDQSQSQQQQQQFMIHNVAISDIDGTILFPNVNDTIGIENKGIADCEKNHNHCVTVPLYRLDTFMKQYIQLSNDSPTTTLKGTSKHKHQHKHQQDVQLIDLLSIDVEGFDVEVLNGAKILLQQTKYIEFEYNWKGNWKKHSLSNVIDMLQELNFICYWPGTNGHIWRITDMFQEYYNLQFWSNVACVHIYHASELYDRMEQLFQTTLLAHDKIQYNDKSTANTDGGYH